MDFGDDGLDGLISPAGNSKHQLRPILMPSNLRILIRMNTSGPRPDKPQPSMSVMKIGENLNSTSLGSEMPLVRLPCLESLSSSLLRAR